ncbi:MAG: hypothetical protein IT472_08850 [Thermomonas sp.]|uniref:hypothetical protein n=1 Tax=Thermomonas sp. TaxID=1971895 RepID=UPI00261B4065|nr:hypothetical protein [Thermomonas sp.]MCC7097273.1 hypothetical protein [Thermomonas sp.]
MRRKAAAPPTAEVAAAPASAGAANPAAPARTLIVPAEAINGAATTTVSPLVIDSGDDRDLAGKVLVVRTASGRTFRRAGYAFGTVPLPLPVDEIGVEAARAILAEDALIVELASPDAPAG